MIGSAGFNDGVDVNVISKLSSESLQLIVDVESETHGNSILYSLFSLLRETPPGFSIDDICKLRGDRLNFVRDKTFTAEQIMHPKFSSDIATLCKKGKGKFEELCNLAPYQLKALLSNKTDYFNHRKELILQNVIHKSFTLKHWNVMRDLDLSFDEIITLNASELRDLEEGVTFSEIQKTNQQRLASLESKKSAELATSTQVALVTFSSTSIAVSKASSTAISVVSTDSAQTGAGTLSVSDISKGERKREQKTS